MTPEQVEVWNIIRSNPYYCKNEQELKERTYEIKTDIENMLPKLEARLHALGPITQDNQEQANQIVEQEMRKVLKNNHNAVIVRADIKDKALDFIHRDHQAYLIYYFEPSTIEPYTVMMSVDPFGLIYFYTPPLLLAEENNPQPAKLLNKEVGKRLCHILNIPDYLLDQGPLLRVA